MSDEARATRESSPLRAKLKSERIPAGPEGSGAERRKRRGGAPSPEKAPQMAQVLVEDGPAVATAGVSSQGGVAERDSRRAAAWGRTGGRKAR